MEQRNSGYIIKAPERTGHTMYRELILPATELHLLASSAFGLKVEVADMQSSQL